IPLVSYVVFLCVVDHWPLSFRDGAGRSCGAYINSPIGTSLFPPGYAPQPLLRDEPPAPAYPRGGLGDWYTGGRHCPSLRGRSAARGDWGYCTIPVKVRTSGEAYGVYGPPASNETVNIIAYFALLVNSCS